MPREPRRYLRLPTPEQIAVQAQAVELWSCKLTFAQIAFELDCSVGHAHNLVTRGLRFYLRDHGAEQTKTEILARINVALEAIMPRVRRGDDSAIDRMDKLNKRLADLFGLDAPKTVRVESVPVDALDAEILRLASQLSENDALPQPDRP